MFLTKTYLPGRPACESRSQHRSQDSTGTLAGDATGERRGGLVGEHVPAQPSIAAGGVLRPVPDIAPGYCPATPWCATRSPCRTTDGYPRHGRRGDRSERLGTAYRQELWAKCDCTANVPVLGLNIEHVPTSSRDTLESLPEPAGGGPNRLSCDQTAVTARSASYVEMPTPILPQPSSCPSPRPSGSGGSPAMRPE